MQYLGKMEYSIVCTPAYFQKWFPSGFSIESIYNAPAVVYNQKDKLHQQYLNSIFHKNIVGYPLLWHVITRIKHSKRIDRIVVATTESEADKHVLNLATELEVEGFAGSEDDVLEGEWGTEPRSPCHAAGIGRRRRDVA